MIKKSFLCFFVVVLGLQVGCRSYEQDENSVTVVDKAYWLIENGEIQKAVTTLDQALAEDPYNNEVRIALASTYAQMAGLDVGRFFNIAESFVGEIRDQKGSTRFYALEKHLISDLGPRGEEVARQLAILAAVDRALYQIDLIPSVGSEQASYTERALDVMNGISSPTPGQALFRGVLGAVDFKHQWDKKVFWGSSLLCHVNPRSVSRGLSALEYVLVKVMGDLAIGLPKESDQILKGQRNLKRAISESRQLLKDDSDLSIYYAELLLGQLEDGCE